MVPVLGFVFRASLSGKRKLSSSRTSFPTDEYGPFIGRLILGTCKGLGGAKHGRG